MQVKMRVIFLIVFLFPLFLVGQVKTNSEKFWNKIQAHCGEAYEGEIIEGAVAGDGFTGEKLVMHVRSCGPNEIRIPFFVGENKSRTWVLRMNPDKTITLKHDHRHPDGSEEELTQYGGTSANHGLEDLQMFPADAHTSTILPAASANVWWFTLSDKSLTYNLRRIGSDRYFSVSFNLGHTVETPAPPWGTVD